MELLCFSKMDLKMELNFFKANKYIYGFLYFLNNFINPFEFKKNFLNYKQIRFFSEKDIFRDQFQKETKKSVVYCYPSFTSALMVINFFEIVFVYFGYQGVDSDTGMIFPRITWPALLAKL